MKGNTSFWGPVFLIVALVFVVTFIFPNILEPPPPPLATPTVADGSMEEWGVPYDGPATIVPKEGVATY